MKKDTADVSASASVNLEDKLVTMLRNYATRTQQPGSSNTPLDFTGHQIEQAKLSGESISSSVVGSVEILTVSQNTLRNSLPHEVSLPVSGFSYKETSETSTTNSTGWVFTYGLQTTASVDVVFASGGVTHNFSVEYNMATEQTVTDSWERTWTVEPFSVPVPGNRVYRVSYVLERVTSSGRSRIRAEFFGTGNYRARTNGVQSSYRFGDVARIMSDWGTNPSQSEGFLDGGWPHNQAVTSAETHFRTDFAVRFDVEIYDITNVRNAEEKGTLIKKFEIINKEVTKSRSPTG